jgi:hypothetical protein
MNNLNKITKILGATLVLTASSYTSNALAASVNSTATTTVQNAFVLTEDTALDFGTVRATQDASGGTNISKLKLSSSDGTITLTADPAGTSTLSQLSAGSVGQFTVSGAAAYVDLKIVVPGTFNLSNATAPSTSPDLVVTLPEFTVRGGANDGDAYVATTGNENLQTDSTGTVSFDLGATLSTDTATDTTTQYIDDVYSGTYAIEVTY